MGSWTESSIMELVKEVRKLAAEVEGQLLALMSKVLVPVEMSEAHPVEI